MFVTEVRLDIPALRPSSGSYGTNVYGYHSVGGHQTLHLTIQCSHESMMACYLGIVPITKEALHIKNVLGNMMGLSEIKELSTLTDKDQKKACKRSKKVLGSSDRKLVISKDK